MQNEEKVSKKLIYLLIVALVVLVIALMLPRNTTPQSATNLRVERECKEWIEDIV